MSDVTFDLCGVEVVPDLSGAAWFPELQLLAVADLHFEKGTSFARQGLHLPPYDTKATLIRLADVCRRLQPEMIVALGDSFHDAEGAKRLDDDDVGLLKALAADARFIWIHGNHDPLGSSAYERLRGEFHEALNVGPLLFRHEPTGARGEVAGHLHPGAAVHVRGRRIRRRCFASDGDSLILPAFGAYTGSLNVCDPAFHPVLKSGFRAYLIGRDGIYPFSEARLKEDRMAG